MESWLSSFQTIRLESVSLYYCHLICKPSQWLMSIWWQCWLLCVDADTNKVYGVNFVLWQRLPLSCVSNPAPLLVQYLHDLGLQAQVLQQAFLWREWTFLSHATSTRTVPHLQEAATRQICLLQRLQRAWRFTIQARHSISDIICLADIHLISSHQ